jgi:hypothetical protein
MTSAIGGYRGYGGYPGYRIYGGYRGLRGYGFERPKLYAPVAPVLVKTVIQPVPIVKRVEVPVVKYVEVPVVKKIAVPVPVAVSVYPKVYSKFY